MASASGRWQDWRQVETDHRHARPSNDQLGRVLHEEGFSYQHPKHTMKGKRDEAAYERARRQLKRLKKRPSHRMLTKC